MQPIIVDGVPVVDPQLATVIGNNTESIMAGMEDSHAACPSHCKMVATSKAGPSAASIAVVYNMTPASHVRPAIVQVLAATTLTKIECIFSEQPMAVHDTMTAMPPAPCAHCHPSVSGVVAAVSEKHPCVTTMFKHLKSH
jgi:hypothetical protein